MKRATIVLMIVLVAASATHPQVKIENGCYKDYKYGFVLDLPGSDWVPVEMIASQLPAATLREFSKNPMFQLVNTKTNGTICVKIDKTELLPSEIVRGNAAVQEGMPILAKIMLGGKNVKQCHDPSTYLQDGDTCIEFDHEEAMPKLKVNMFMRHFSVRNNVYLITISLGANPTTYKQDFLAFVKLVKSLRHGDQYTIE